MTLSDRPSFDRPLQLEIGGEAPFALFKAMRILIFLVRITAFAALGFSLVRANPKIVIVEEESGSTSPQTPVHETPVRQVQMVAEDVVIKVSYHYSMVTGKYVFNQLPKKYDTTALGSAEKPAYIAIIVPVFLPTGNRGRDFIGWKEAAEVKIRLHEKTYEPVDAEEIYTYNEIYISTLTKLPDDWRLIGFEADIPVKDVGESLALTISYRQPHFDGYVSHYSDYCAMISDPIDTGIKIQPSDFTISFEPMDGTVLRLITHHKYIVTNALDKIVVHPAVGLDDIVVQVN
jgi:hypothetical protein